MATRCQILIGPDADNEYVGLYRHWDGYPSSILPELNWALPRSEETPSADDIARRLEAKGEVANVDGAHQHWEYNHRPAPAEPARPGLPARRELAPAVGRGVGVYWVRWVGTGWVVEHEGGEEGFAEEFLACIVETLAGKREIKL